LFWLLIYDNFLTQFFEVDFVEFNDPKQLEAKFQSDENIAGFIFEPIQGNAGNIHPDPGYYIKVRELCTKYNVLMISDEVQVGLGRCGKLLCCEWENVRADIVTLGKSLSGGFMPVSAVLADNDIMNVWEVGDHASTYAGNPLGLAIVEAAMDVLLDEDLIIKAEKLGKILAEELESFHYPFIKDMQYGKGLFGSLQFPDKLTMWTIAKNMMENGVFVKPDPGERLKIMPPLCISEEDLRKGLKVLKDALDDFEKKGKLGLIG